MSCWQKAPSSTMLTASSKPVGPSTSRPVLRQETSNISARQPHWRRPAWLYPCQWPTPRAQNLLIPYSRGRILASRRQTSNRSNYLHMRPMPDFTRPNHEPENGRFTRNTPLENTALLQVWHRRLRTLQDTPWQSHTCQPGSSKGMGINILMPVLARRTHGNFRLHGHCLIQVCLQSLPGSTRRLRLLTKRCRFQLRWG